MSPAGHLRREIEDLLHPDRADYQVDLATSLVKIADFVEEPKEILSQALIILKTLDSEGRLAPTDRPKIQALENALADSG